MSEGVPIVLLFLLFLQLLVLFGSWWIWALYKVGIAYVPRVDASYARCMDVQKRMSRHGLLPLASEEETEGVTRSVPNKALALVEKKMVDIAVVEEDREEHFNVTFRLYPRRGTPMRMVPRRTLLSYFV